MQVWLIAGLAATALTTTALAAPPASQQTPRATFYVAPNGSDTWSGRLKAPNAAKNNGPFATITRARDAVRQLKANEGGLKQPITVLIRGGVYRLPETLTFTAEDSGTATCPITYTAAAGETPIFTGGRRITGWKKGDGALWTARIPAVAEGKWYFHQLFVNGTRRTRARTPNEGYLYSAGPLVPLDREKAQRDVSTKIGFRFKEGDLKEWNNLEDVNVIAYHAWTASWHFIDKLDMQAHTVKFTAPCGWPMSWWENEQRYFVENCREALDSPGEWYLDRKSGVLTYWPLPGEDMKKASAYAPELRTLVRFAGEPELGLYVENIRLVGLSFQHADWVLAHNECHDGQAAISAGSAVTGSGMRQCALERCEIAHVGEHALWLTSGCQGNRFEQNHIHDMGAGGVYIGEGHHATIPAVSTGRNVVYNNFIHDGGHVYQAGIGVWVGQSGENIISHNEICDFFYSGMSLGWTWGYGASAARGNIVEYNHIHDLGKGVLSDMGGIYTLGISPGTVERNNLVHDVLSFSYGGWGLYTDEGSTNILLENNVVYRTKSGGFHQHYGRENTLRNNIFAVASEGEIIRSRQEEHISFTFEKNVVYQNNGPLLGGNWSNKNYRMDHNLYWQANDEAEFNGYLLDEWRQEMGQDQHSVVADPLFVNPAKNDFRLKPNSPAFKLGFKPIDLSKVGLVGEKAWTDLPKKIKRAPVVLPTAATMSKKVDDGFEDTAAGKVPANCTVSGSTSEASILVTDETAASGKHSLKFTDAPGLAFDWQPHLFYQPSFLRGPVRLSYDLRVEPGAIAWMECRDGSGSYRVGPSLKATNGKLTAGDTTLMDVPMRQWLHFEITTTLGRQGNSAYDLAVTLPGGETRTFQKLSFGNADFRNLKWIGFISLATDKAVFYLDNIKAENVK